MQHLEHRDVKESYQISYAWLLSSYELLLFQVNIWEVFKCVSYNFVRIFWVEGGISSLKHWCEECMKHKVGTFSGIIVMEIQELVDFSLFSQIIKRVPLFVEFVFSA